ncbi:hypothetical protein [Georgenia sp. AZ-5]|uniref:hypothetical protein n=1 Tax=Georgenia sp. AZ-5 TaxID=3367526 RepID=UPI0037553230
MSTDTPAPDAQNPPESPPDRPAAGRTDPQTGTGPSEHPEGDTEPHSEPDGEGKGKDEARRYRQRAQRAEQERDTLRQRVTTMQRREAEREASRTLAAPGDLWTVGGVKLEDVLGDDGEVDPTKVDEAVAGIIAVRPGLRRTRWPDTGQTHRGEPPAQSVGWDDVLRHKMRTPGPGH